MVIFSYLFLALTLFFVNSHILAVVTAVIKRQDYNGIYFIVVLPMLLLFVYFWSTYGFIF